MLKNRRTYKRLSHVAVAGLLTGLGVYAQAGDLSLSSNQVNITGPNSYSAAAALQSNGILSNVEAVPLTGTMGIPSFNFTLVQSNGTLTNGDYTFRVGVVIDDNATSRRLEAKLSTLTLTVTNNGATITGSIPDQSLRVLARDGSGSVTVLADVNNASTNGPISVTGGTVAFNADTLVARIAAKNTDLAKIVSEFNSASHYTYSIVVQPVTAPAIVGFGTNSAGAFTALPKVRTACAASPSSQSASVFLLNASELAGSFTEAYAVQGQFSVKDSTSSFSTLSAFSDTCTIATTGGTTPVTPVVPPATATDVTNQINQIVLPPVGSTTPVSTVVEAQVNNAINTASNLATNVGAQIAAGTVDTFTALSSLTTAGNALTTAGTANTIGATINMDTAVGSINNIANALSALTTGRTLSTAEITTATNLVLSTIESSTKLIDTSLTPAQVNSVISANVSLLQSLIRETGSVPAALVTQAQTLASAAFKQVATSLPTTLTKGVDFNNTPALTTLLSSSPTLTNKVLESSVIVKEPTVHVVPTTVTDSFPLAAREFVSTTLTSRARLDKASSGGESFLIKLQRGLASAPTASAALQPGLNAAAATGDSVTVDDANGTLNFKVGTANIVAVSSGGRIVPSTVASGVRSLPDGRTFMVEGGIAMDLAPTTVNTLGFMAAVVNAGFTPSFRANGSVGITLSAGQSFSGAFTYGSVGSTTAATCGAISFVAPTGSPADAAYAFSAKCANGTTQLVTPFAADPAFYNTLGNAGLEVTTDRNTGAVTVGTVGKFKPSFFVNALTAADTTFLNANKNADGVAFRAKESNGDGKMDYEFISASGVQILYGM